MKHFWPDDPRHRPAVSLQSSPEQLREVCGRAKNEEKTFCEIEREVMGIDHQQLGAALTEIWKFPRTCQLVPAITISPSSLRATACSWG
jgi:hypothetical protein